jgi:hypothetical protein
MRLGNKMRTGKNVVQRVVENKSPLSLRLFQVPAHIHDLLID